MHTLAIGSADEPDWQELMCKAAPSGLGLAGSRSLQLIHGGRLGYIVWLLRTRQCSGCWARLAGRLPLLTFRLPLLLQQLPALHEVIPSLCTLRQLHLTFQLVHRHQARPSVQETTISTCLQSLQTVC